MKKAIIAGTSIATMALMAMPALASNNCCGDRHHRNSCCPEVTVINADSSSVSTINVTAANSGLNSVRQRGGLVSNNEAVIETFDADASANTGNVVNNSAVEAEQDSGKVTVVNANRSRVRTANVSIANSGGNTVRQSGGVFSSNSAEVYTGNATSSSNVINVVGNSVTEIDD